MIRKHTFNMIEVVLALLVISIGIMSITGLVPIGTKAHQDSLSYNRAADLATDALHETAAELQKSWSYSGPSTNPIEYKIYRDVKDEDGNVIRTVVDYEVTVEITIEGGQEGYYYDSVSGGIVGPEPLDNIKLIKAVATWGPSEYPQTAQFALEVMQQ